MNVCFSVWIWFFFSFFLDYFGFFLRIDWTRRYNCQMRFVDFVFGIDLWFLFFVWNLIFFESIVEFNWISILHQFFLLIFSSSSPSAITIHLDMDGGEAFKKLFLFCFRILYYFIVYILQKDNIAPCLWQTNGGQQVVNRESTRLRECECH